MVAKKIEPKDFVKTTVELCEQLGISRQTLWKLRRMPANPGKNADGMFDVQAWDRFYAEVSAENATQQSLTKEAREELSEIRVQRETLTMEREAILLEKLKDRLIEVDKVNTRIMFHHERFVKLVRETLLSIPSLSADEINRLFNEFQERAHKLLLETENAESQSEI